jgi:hypothetical protein
LTFGVSTSVNRAFFGEPYSSTTIAFIVESAVGCISYLPDSQRAALADDSYDAAAAPVVSNPTAGILAVAHSRLI